LLDYIEDSEKGSKNPLGEKPGGFAISGDAAEPLEAAMNPAAVMAAC